MHSTISTRLRRIGVSRQWITQALDQIARRLKLPAKTSVSVICVGDARMKTLHALYSGEATVTDVLSFPAHESYDVHWAGVEDQHELGEIVVCVPQIIRQAKTNQVSYRVEFARMLAHGMLHLLGHDHAEANEAKTMYALQEKLVYTIDQ